jgi:hypothetical protein
LADPRLVPTTESKGAIAIELDLKHHVSMFVAKLWAKQANDLSEWMALLERNTAPLGNN